MKKDKRREYEELLSGDPHRLEFLDFVERASGDIRYYRNSSHVFRILEIVLIVCFGVAVYMGVTELWRLLNA